MRKSRDTLRLLWQLGFGVRQTARPKTTRDRLTLAEWQSHSGFDATSSTHWYTLGVGDPPRSELFVNDTAAVQVLPLVDGYLDLDQQAVTGSRTLQPYTSRILIRDGSGLIFEDGFEPGDTSAW